MLAIDPSSPFTGGAILGDRVRMQDHAARRRRVHPLDGDPWPPRRAGAGDAARRSGCSTPPGSPWVLVETVGVGQVEVEVAGAADTTVVVVNPGWGDAVQANKAGLLEIADVFVINKADRPGVDETRRDLEHMLDLSALGDVARRRSCATVAIARASGDRRRCGGAIARRTAPTSRRRRARATRASAPAATSCARSSRRHARGSGRYELAAAARRSSGSRPTSASTASIDP